ncbi:NAD(P)-binding protein [Meredithblackwellia eburnea MCA 4105]
MATVGPITAYAQRPAQTAGQSQVPPIPPAEHTKVERWDSDGKPYLEEYQGSGKLAGKSAIVAGGDSGIGRAVAIMFAREGADVSIIYYPSGMRSGEAVKEGIEAAGRKCLLIPGDLRDRKFCEDAVAKHVAQFGAIHVLVNNAAQQGHCLDMSKIDLDYAEQTFKLNIHGPMAMTKFALPFMPRGSSIINTVSIGAYAGELMVDKVDYSSTKGALVSFTRSLALQQAPKGIRVNCVAPGPIWTPLHAETRNIPEGSLDTLEFNTPLHGRMGQPAELGPSYVYLASSDSNYMTGQCLHVSAGMWTGS